MSVLGLLVSKYILSLLFSLIKSVWVNGFICYENFIANEGSKLYGSGFQYGYGANASCVVCLFLSLYMIHEAWSRGLIPGELQGNFGKWAFILLVYEETAFITLTSESVSFESSWTNTRESANCVCTRSHRITADNVSWHTFIHIWQLKRMQYSSWLTVGSIKGVIYITSL